MKCGISNMEEKIKSIIENVLGLSSLDYDNSSNFKEDLGCDSLDLVDVIMECEREFNICIPDDDVDKIMTVQGLIDYVIGRCKQYPNKRNSKH
jgi:acyl carrier protein